MAATTPARWHGLDTVGELPPVAAPIFASWTIMGNCCA